MDCKKIEKLFTLILLVKGRDDFTKRWLNYFDEIDFKFPIIISDGANDGYVKNLIHNHTFKNNIKITFKQFDTNDGFEKYYQMKRDTLNSVETKYSMICDNDDFIIKTGLYEIINFLEYNDDYISASGKILNFEIDNWKYHTYGDIFFLPEYDYTRLEDPLNDWSKQIKSIFNEFQPNFYNVFRTEELKKIFNETAQHNFSDLTINEFFIQLRANTLGKSKILNCHHYFRQRGTSQISNHFDFSKDIIKKNLPEDVRRLNKIICDILKNQTNSAPNNLYDIFETSFSEYLKNLIAATMLRYRFPLLFKYKVFLKNLWFEKLKFISKLFKQLKNIIYINFEIKNSETRKELINLIKFVKQK